MITWLTMLIQKIEGSNLLLIIIGAMWILYLGFFFVVKANRGKQKLKTALIAGAIATLICDIVWFFKFFDNFQYVNPGLGGMMWFMLLPVLLFFLVMILSYINASRYEFDKKKREKEAAKAKKKEKHRKKFENQENAEK
ncbi:MAG: hypothetical protein IKK14_07175 [Oscillospiraceae bacterium]|nr:hypothetical protein [Oscillospiraceae bacterium]